MVVEHFTLKLKTKHGWAQKWESELYFACTCAIVGSGVQHKVRFHRG